MGQDRSVLKVDSYFPGLFVYLCVSIIEEENWEEGGVGRGEKRARWEVFDIRYVKRLRSLLTQSLFMSVH